MEDPGPGGGGDDLNVQRHPVAPAAGDQNVNGEVEMLLYPLKYPGLLFTSVQERN